MKFTQPVAMAIPSQEDFERDLKEPLIKLGRKLIDIDNFQRLPILSTCIKEDNNESNSAISNYSEFLNYENYYFIPTYNPQLYIALSSMSDEVNGIVGEYWVEHELYTPKHIFKSCYTKEQNLLGEYNPCDESYHVFVPSKYTRKATKEELINHFTKTENEKIIIKGEGEGKISKFGVGINGKFVEFINPEEHQKMITTYEGRLTELQSKIEGLENEINGLKSVNELLEQDNRTKNTKYNNAMCSVEEQLAINIKDKNTISEQQKDINCLMIKKENLERQLQVREETILKMADTHNFQPKNILPYVLISTSEKVLDRVVFEVKRTNKTPTHHDLIFENEGAKERFKLLYDYELKGEKTCKKNPSWVDELKEHVERMNF